MTSSEVGNRRSVDAFIGIVGAACGLGVAELIAGTNRSLRSPLVDVGDAVIDRAPPTLTKLAIEWFGQNDKAVLLISIAALVVVFAAVVGVMWRRKRVAGIAGLLLFVGFGAWAGLVSLPAGGSAALAVVPVAVGGLVTGGFLELSSARRRGASSSAEGRRRLLESALAGIGLAVGAGYVGRALDAAEGRRLANARVALPTPQVQAPEVSAGATAPVQGAEPFFTPNAAFYRIDTALSVPRIDPEEWTLKVTGLVDEELTLSFDDLVSGDVVEHDITLTCVSNEVGGPLMGTARWTGLRLDRVLEAAGVQAEADQVVGRSIDGYSCGFPTAALDGRPALIAFGMNGELLPAEHGYPARLIVPGLYGYVSATKWLTEIELTTFASTEQYWASRGWDDRAPIKVSSRIDTPKGLERVEPGPTAIAGVAWAQTRGIDGVQVSIDDGPWIDARMADEVNDVTWRQWWTEWDATPGSHSISVRAKERNGPIQTSTRVEPKPNGATGHHQIVVLVSE